MQIQVQRIASHFVTGGTSAHYGAEKCVDSRDKRRLGADSPQKRSKNARERREAKRGSGAQSNARVRSAKQGDGAESTATQSKGRVWRAKQSEGGGSTATQSKARVRRAEQRVRRAKQTCKERSRMLQDVEEGSRLQKRTDAGSALEKYRREESERGRA